MGDRFYMQQREGRRMRDSLEQRDLLQKEKERRKIPKSSTVPDWSYKRKGRSPVKRPVLRIKFI